MKARIKILTAFLYILTVVLYRNLNLPSFLFFFIPLLSLILISRVDLKNILKRTAALMPFTIIVAAFIPFIKEGTAGLVLFGQIVARSFLSIMAMNLLISTSGFSELLEGLAKLRVPGIMILLLSFIHRYFFVLSAEIKRMDRARGLRCPRGGIFSRIFVTGHIIAALFVRTLGRAERVYYALRLRGFNINGVK